jgi:general secretion pathway protein D
MKFFRLIALIVLIGYTSIYAANKSKEEINITFTDMPLEDVVKFIAKTTQKNILLNDKLSGKVNFISNKPITKGELLPLLNNILKSRSFTLVENGPDYIEIAREADAKRIAPVGEKSDISMSTDIVRLKNVKANEIVAKIKHLGSKYGVIISDKNLNILFITDYQENTKNILKVIDTLDVPTDKEITYLSIQNYDVDKLHPQITAVLKSLENNFAGSVDLIKDSSSNTLAVIADKEDMKEAVELVENYDAQGAKVPMESRIIILNNIDSKDAIATVKLLLKDLDVNAKIKTNISENKELNAIALTGEKKQLDVVSELIESLDIEKKQVYIKAQIYEISKNKTDKIGSKWGLAAGYTDSLAVLSTAIGMGGTSFALPDVISGTLDLGSLSKGLAAGATIDFLKQNGAVNTLSEPHLLCVNNLESSIYVGETRSILTSTVTGDTATSDTKNSYTRTDIGIKLSIKPRISSDSKVTLEIKTKVENADQSDINTDKPTTTKREVITSAVVRNAESVIIGGLIRDDSSVSMSKVPLLGDIPLIGELFKHRSTAGDKLNMVVIITPFIVDQSSDLGTIQSAIAEFDGLKEKMAKKMQEFYDSQSQESLFYNTQDQ